MNTSKTPKQTPAETIERRGPFRLAGIAARTKNSDELNGNGKIAALWQRFFAEQVAGQIQGQKRPGEIIAAYTDFESDENGFYTILIGADIETTAFVPETLTCIDIPQSLYRIVSTQRGRLSEVGLKAWRQIWQEPALKSGRTFRADLEIYGADAADPEHARFDILLGVRD